MDDRNGPEAPYHIAVEKGDLAGIGCTQPHW
jgi:hypothetical protein